MLEYCERHGEWLRGTIEDLVRLESPSTDKAAVDRCGAAVEELLVSMGGDVRRLRQDARGDHLRAEWGGGQSQVLLLGHFDTVWPVGSSSACRCAGMTDASMGRASST